MSDGSVAVMPRPWPNHRVWSHPWCAGFVVFFAPDTPTQVLCALLVTIVALAVSNNVRPFMRTCDDVGNVVMQYQVRLVARV